MFLVSQKFRFFNNRLVSPLSSLRTFKKILEKSDDFAENLAQNWADWYKNGSLFSWKIGICMGLLSNFAAACPYQNQSTPPPRSIYRWVIKYDKPIWYTLKILGKNQYLRHIQKNHQFESEVYHLMSQSEPLYGSTMKLIQL